MKTTEKLIGLLLVLLMQGCVVYRTQTADIPLISSKNEIKIDGGISLAPSANVTVSYGLTNKIAVQAFASHTSLVDNYYQGAAGIYKNLNKNNVLELYAGVGSGHASAYKDATGGHLKGNYQTYFTQFNFGKIKSKTSHVEYGFAIKTGLLHSNLTDEHYYDLNTPEPYKTYANNNFLLEPGVFIRMGGEKLKFNIRLNGCWISQFSNTDKYIPYTYLNLGLSLNYTIKK